MILVSQIVDVDIDYGVDISVSILGIFDTVELADKMVKEKYPEEKYPECEVNLSSNNNRYVINFVDNNEPPGYDTFHIYISFKNIDLNVAIEKFIGCGYYQE